MDTEKFSAGGGGVTGVGAGPRDDLFVHARL